MADQHNNQQLSGQQSDADEWTHCAAGTLGAFASKERFRRLRRRTLSVGGAVASCCVLLLAVSYLPGLTERSTPGPAEPLNSIGSFPPYGGLSCRDVVHDLEPFFAGSIPENRHGRIRQHLDDCPACKRVYQDAAESRGVSIAQQDLREPVRDTVDSDLSFVLATR